VTIEDAALCPFDELARRVAAWEDYYAKYPEWRPENWARDMPGAFLSGSDNSRLFQGHPPRLDPSARKAYEDYIRNRPNTDTGRKVAAFYAVVKKHDFIWNLDLQRQLEAAGFHVLPPAGWSGDTQ
jgi:hypothetical protein